jgi:hypothetical protein
MVKINTLIVCFIIVYIIYRIISSIHKTESESYDQITNNIKILYENLIGPSASFFGPSVSNPPSISVSNPPSISLSNPSRSNVNIPPATSVNNTSGPSISVNNPSQTSVNTPGLLAQSSINAYRSYFNSPGRTIDIAMRLPSGAIHNRGCKGQCINCVVGSLDSNGCLVNEKINNK